VTDLLNDINEFSPKEIHNSNKKTWYCLQPIVVKQKSENECDVIDGQQRLRTILEFVSDGFSVMKIHDEEVAGLKYSQLSEELQQIITNSDKIGILNQCQDSIDHHINKIYHLQTFLLITIYTILLLYCYFIYLFLFFYRFSFNITSSFSYPF
jgi:hypothetical protein